MQVSVYQPTRRAMLRAGSASLAALAIAVCSASYAAAGNGNPAEVQGEFDAGQRLPARPDHRHIIGLL